MTEVRHVDLYYHRSLRLAQTADKHRYGKGIRLAILDTGFDASHHEFAGRRPMLRSCTVSELPVHGTAVASIAAGNSIGIARNSDLIFISAMRERVETDDLISGLYSALACRADVVLIAGGVPRGSRALSETCDRVIISGCRIVAATGNRDDGGVDYPAAYPAVVGVYACDRWGQPLRPVPVKPEGVLCMQYGDGIRAAALPTGYNTVKGSSAAAAIEAGHLCLRLSYGGKDVKKQTDDNGANDTDGIVGGDGTRVGGVA